MPKIPKEVQETYNCDRCKDTGVIEYSYLGSVSHEKCPCGAFDKIPKEVAIGSQYLPHNLYIGIDPGQDGGLCYLSSGKIEATPMPETERNVWLWFRDLQTFNICHAVIEKVHSMPDQGVASSFKFGLGYGQLRMALIAAQIPFEEVTPQAWQKALGIPPKKKEESKAQWKNRLLALAQQLFPDLPLWTEKKTKGKQLAIADALLIAEYCKRKQEGKL